MSLFFLSFAFFFPFFMTVINKIGRFFHCVNNDIKQDVGLESKERRFLKHNVGTVFGSLDS